MHQATSLTRMAQILDECSVSKSDPQVTAIAIDKLAMMGSDVESGNAEAFKLLGMEERAQALCEAAANEVKAHRCESDITFHVWSDALAGLTDLSRTFNTLCDHPAVQVRRSMFIADAVPCPGTLQHACQSRWCLQEYVNALIDVGMSKWHQWKVFQHVHSVQDLACLLDSIAFLCPVRTSASDALTMKVVIDLKASIKSIPSDHSISMSDIGALCDGVWALAAFYSNSRLQLHPRVTIACAAEILQLEHPNNTAKQRLYTSYGSCCDPKPTSWQASLPNAVTDCLDVMCKLITGQAILNTNANFLLRHKDAAVKVLAGVPFICFSAHPVLVRLCNAGSFEVASCSDKSVIMRTSFCFGQLLSTILFGLQGLVSWEFPHHPRRIA